MHDAETTELNRYLLGELPEDEVDRLERRLLADQELFEQAEIAEDELVDAYARGELCARECQLFEQSLLGSPRIRERLTMAKALGHAAQGRSGPAPRAAVAPDRPSLWERLFPAPARLAWAATLVVAVAGGVFAYSNLQLLDRVDELEAARRAAVAEIEVLEQERGVAGPVEEEAGTDALEERLAARDAELAAERERLARLETELDEARATERRRRRAVGDAGGGPYVAVFLPLASRSGGEDGGVPVVDPERLGEAAGAELELSLGAEPNGPLTARVTKGETLVWVEERLPLSGQGIDTVALLRLPRELLTPGRYRVELRRADGALEGIHELTVP